MQMQLCDHALVWSKYQRLDKYLGLELVKSSAFDTGLRFGPTEIISCICVILIERLKYVKFDKYPLKPPFSDT